VVIGAVAVVCSAVAQKRFSSENPSIRADSRLVLVPTIVVDMRGAFVNGLGRDAFNLTEDGVRQQIRWFSEEDAPVSMGIVLDLSGSMKGVLGAAKESLRTLLNDANPADEAFLNAVSTRPRAFSGFTQDFDEILSGIAFERAAGNTALFDTISNSLKQLHSGVHTRKALLVISDRMDNHSRYSRADLMKHALESGAQIYTIAVGGGAPPYAKAMELIEAKRGLLFLDELAAKTGGMSFLVRDRTDIGKAAASIGRALRNQYSIGYVPTGNGHSGQWRRIRVKVEGSGMRAYARAGYRLD
jgi:Ca-activated chloride channel family protein